MINVGGRSSIAMPGLLFKESNARIRMDNSESVESSALREDEGNDSRTSTLRSSCRKRDKDPCNEGHGLEFHSRISPSPSRSRHRKSRSQPFPQPHHDRQDHHDHDHRQRQQHHHHQQQQQQQQQLQQRLGDAVERHSSSLNWLHSPRTSYTYAHSPAYRDRWTPESNVPLPNMARRPISFYGSDLEYTSSVSVVKSSRLVGRVHSFASLVVRKILYDFPAWVMTLDTYLLLKDSNKENILSRLLVWTFYTFIVAPCTAFTDLFRFGFEDLFRERVEERSGNEEFSLFRQRPLDSLKKLRERLAEVSVQYRKQRIKHRRRKRRMLSLPTRRSRRLRGLPAVQYQLPQRKRRRKRRRKRVDEEIIEKGSLVSDLWYSFISLISLYSYLDDVDDDDDNVDDDDDNNDDDEEEEVEEGRKDNKVQNEESIYVRKKKYGPFYYVAVALSYLWVPFEYLESLYFRMRMNLVRKISPQRSAKDSDYEGDDSSDEDSDDEDERIEDSISSRYLVQDLWTYLRHGEIQEEEEVIRNKETIYNYITIDNTTQRPTQRVSGSSSNNQSGIKRLFHIILYPFYFFQSCLGSIVTMMRNSETRSFYSRCKGVLSSIRSGFDFGVERSQIYLRSLLFVAGTLALHSLATTVLIFRMLYDRMSPSPTVIEIPPSTEGSDDDEGFDSLSEEDLERTVVRKNMAYFERHQNGPPSLPVTPSLLRTTTTKICSFWWLIPALFFFGAALAYYNHCGEDYNAYHDSMVNWSKDHMDSLALIIRENKFSDWWNRQPPITPLDYDTIALKILSNEKFLAYVNQQDKREETEDKNIQYQLEDLKEQMSQDSWKKLEIQELLNDLKTKIKDLSAEDSVLADLERRIHYLEELTHKLSTSCSCSSSELLEFIKEDSEFIEWLDKTFLTEREHRESLSKMKKETGNDIDSMLSVESVVNQIVREALIRYDADKTGRFDYALESAGGSVVSTRCTETFVKRTALYTLFGIPLWYPPNNPRTAIQPGVHPGECWAFKGSEGHLVIQLSNPIIPNMFSLEHIPKSMSPTGEIDSAPKDFSVYGLSHEKDQEPVHLGKYRYSDEGDPLQSFPFEPRDDRSYKFIELSILSNHGNVNYTCLYRFRVHGILAKEESLTKDSE